MKNLIILLIITILQGAASGQIKVVASTTVINDLVKNIGGNKVETDYLCRGDQDPHFLEVMPKYMMKLRNADLFLKIGMGLETWAPQLVDGSRNSRLKVLELTEGIAKKEVPAGKIDASRGDIHPYGNPHYWMDPENAKIMAAEIYRILSDESPADEAYFKSNLDAYTKKLNDKIKDWDARMAPFKGKPFLFFHASWIYFADHFGIRIAGYVEPKPGIVPTPAHNAELYSIIKSNNVKYILMENFYSDNAPKQISAATGVKVVKVATGVYGAPGADSYIQMMDLIINQLTKAS